MDTKKKPAPEANREAGYDIAFDSHNHSPIHARLEALLALLALLLWSAMQ